ncbi:MAG: aconitase X [Acidimicrobiia bacterium]
MLAGEKGPGRALAMRVVAETAMQMGATRLLDIASAHIDSCLFHGLAGLDFARKLLEGGARTAVPATLNVGALDLLHPELYRGPTERAELSRELMETYELLGCAPTWTCAPYQLAARPRFGEQVAWAESNAVVFVNSVIGARSNRYGDFIDISCAVTGRAPATGLHLDAGRQAEMEIRIGEGLPLEQDWLYPILGCVVGEIAGTSVPLLSGLPPGLSDDRLKALGAGAATTGSVGLFHAIDSTPEALDRTSLPVAPRAPAFDIGLSDVERMRAILSTAAGAKPDAVSLGAPHYSTTELEILVEMLAGREVRLPTYVNTGRGVIGQRPDLASTLEEAGVTIVTDTCTYLTPILDPGVKVVVTDSGKWAYYAPGNIGVGVIFAPTSECIEVAVGDG